MIAVLGVAVTYIDGTKEAVHNVEQAAGSLGVVPVDITGSSRPM